MATGNGEMEFREEVVTAAERRVLKWLAGGASTDDAAMGALGLGDRLYGKVMMRLEYQGHVERGRYGALEVWRLRRR